MNREYIIEKLKEADTFGEFLNTITKDILVDEMKDFRETLYSLNNYITNDEELLKAIADDGIVEIPRYMFYKSELTAVTIPDSVKIIADSAFAFCRSLKSITIPDNITSIEQDAFWGCSRLTSITIPDSVTSIGDDAFYCCSNLTSITLPKKFISLKELKRLRIGTEVKVIAI